MMGHGLGSTRWNGWGIWLIVFVVELFGVNGMVVEGIVHE